MVKRKCTQDLPAENLPATAVAPQSKKRRLDEPSITHLTPKTSPTSRIHSSVQQPRADQDLSTSSAIIDPNSSLDQSLTAAQKLVQSPPLDSNLSWTANSAHDTVNARLGKQSPDPELSGSLANNHRDSIKRKASQNYEASNDDDNSTRSHKRACHVREPTASKLSEDSVRLASLSGIDSIEASRPTLLARRWNLTRGLWLPPNSPLLHYLRLQEEYIAFRQSQRHNRMPTPEDSGRNPDNNSDRHPEADENGRYPAQFGLDTDDGSRVAEVFGEEYARGFRARKEAREALTASTRRSGFAEFSRLGKKDLDSGGAFANTSSSSDSDTVPYHSSLDNDDDDDDERNSKEHELQIPSNDRAIDLRSPTPPDMLNEDASGHAQELSRAIATPAPASAPVSELKPSIESEQPQAIREQPCMQEKQQQDLTSPRDRRDPNPPRQSSTTRNANKVTKNTRVPAHKRQKKNSTQTSDPKSKHNNGNNVSRKPKDNGMLPSEDAPTSNARVTRQQHTNESFYALDSRGKPYRI